VQELSSTNAALKESLVDLQFKFENTPVTVNPEISARMSMQDSLIENLKSENEKLMERIERLEASLQPNTSKNN
jgi:hypothetical protein